MTRRVKAEIQYPGVIHHVMSRANDQGDVIHNGVDRQDFLQTLAEACQKTGFQVHACSRRRKHYHLVAETPIRRAELGL